MRIDIATLFPEMCEAVLSTSIIGRARRAGFIEIYCHNIRDFSNDKHKRVDDAPYGGGNGMLLKAEPIFRCFEHVCEEACSKPYVIYMSPKGTVLNQEMAVDFAENYDHLFLLCGHYEGVDARITENLADEIISIGDFVLTGGELPAMMITDAVSRMLPEVLGSSESASTDSFYNGLLEHPQYTKPREFEGMKVPDVLVSGDHAKIAQWRREKSLEVTLKNRPDLLEKAQLSEKDRSYLEQLQSK